MMTVSHSAPFNVHIDEHGTGHVQTVFEFTNLTSFGGYRRQQNIYHGILGTTLISTGIPLYQ